MISHHIKIVLFVFYAV